jgi:NADH-quinone oxidoreductase subunit E
MADWTTKTATMSGFGIREAKEPNDAPFDLPEEMAAAMRLMANPAAGAIAMSALGLGIASHAIGFWAGALTGAVQASQRLFTPLPSGEIDGEVAKPTAGPLRDKPFLKVVAKNELAAAMPVAAPTTAAEPVMPAAKRRQPPSPPKPAPVAKPTKAETPERAAEPAKVEAPLQPEDFHRPRTIERPAAPHDLKAISGIGPKLEKVLNDLGIWTYAQIAAWQAREIAWIDDYLGFPGRIDRDGWIAQARVLSAQAGTKS